MPAKPVIKDLEEKMTKSIDAMLHEFNSIRTGRANAALLDGVRVDYYGTPMPVNQVASITTPDARMIVLQPWEKAMLQPIEKAVRGANLGLNPTNDGSVIRLPIPPLNEERRKDMAKLVRKFGEEAKVAIRNVRRDANEKLKKMEKDKQLTEDQLKVSETETQKITDRFIKEIDQHVAHKEKEIQEV